MADKVLATLRKLRDGIDSLSSGTEGSEDYNEGVFDSVRMVDEMIHQWEVAPDEVTEELGLDEIEEGC